MERTNTLNEINVWIKARCNKRGLTAFKTLYEDFMTDHYHVSVTEFGTKLAARFKKRKINGRVFYADISLKSGANKTLETFFYDWLEKRCYTDPGCCTSLDTLYRNFNSSVISKQVFSRLLSQRFVQYTPGIFTGVGIF